MTRDHGRSPTEQHYHTFETSPPNSRGRPPSNESATMNGSPGHDNSESGEEDTSQTPMPVKQMVVLAVIALCEQTALNSISPYLPDMASSFAGVDRRQVGMYVGTIASAFALAQFVTNFFWGWISDRIGRKPVILLGTLLTAACFVAFGFCRTLWQAVTVQAVMGTVNGNQGVVSTCLGEITDRSNQSRAFTYLPVIYGIGGVTGPILGGLLVSSKVAGGDAFPYLGPNIASAIILLFDFVLTTIFLEESLHDATSLPKMRRGFRDLFSWLWHFTSSTRPSYLRSHRRRDRRGTRNGVVHNPDFDDEDDNSDTASTLSEATPLFRSSQHAHLNRDEVLNRDMILLLLTYLIFALSNISFNSLYPIFAQADPPTGRDLTPKEIGLTQAFSGIVTIIFQVCVFGKLRDKMGNRWSYSASLLGFALAFALMPFVGYKDDDVPKGTISKGTILLAIELCVVLLIKSIVSVAGLTSSLLLLTNSAPNHSVLGAVNGLAQTLSAAGRAAGPFLSGGLFSLASRVKPKGEAVAFGIFGGVSVVGFLLSLGIRSRSLEASGWSESASRNDHDSVKSGDENNNCV